MHLPASVAGGDLVSGDGLGQEHRGLEIDAVDLVVRLLGDLEERLLALDAYAVDQYVDTPAALEDRLGRASNRPDRLGVHRYSVRRESSPNQ